MPVEALPGVINDVSLSAKHFRHLAQALAGGPVASFSGGVSAVHPAHGVTGPTNLKVTQASTPAMKVQVAAGLALITGTLSAEQGPYSFYNDAAVELTIAAADGSNPRRDLIVAQVRDDDYGGSSNDARLVVVQGTPAASPVDPSLSGTANGLVLARVTVPAGATSITNANITDLRIGVGGWFAPRGEVGATVLTAPHSGITGTVDITFGGTPLSVAYTARAYRRYRVSLMVRCDQSASAGLSELMVRDAGNNVLNKATFNLAASEILTSTVIARPSVVTADAAATMKATIMLISGGSVSAFGGTTQPMTIVVDDLGGVLA